MPARERKRVRASPANDVWMGERTGLALGEALRNARVERLCFRFSVSLVGL